MLHLALQCPIACPGLAPHTRAGLGALWLPGEAGSCENIHEPAKLSPPQTTCQALLQPPVQAPPHLLHTAEAASDLAVPDGMPRAGHSHTGRALYAVVAECCLHPWNLPQTGKTAPPPHPGNRHWIFVSHRRDTKKWYKQIFLVCST